MDKWKSGEVEEVEKLSREVRSGEVEKAGSETTIVR